MKKNAIAVISRIREEANRFLIREMETRGIKGIVPSHGDIFRVLFTSENCTMKEIAERIHRTKPTVTVLVDKLMEMGYVIKEKSAEDNRVTFIRLTEQGWSVKPILQEISQRLVAKTYKGFSEDEADALESALQKIFDNFVQ